MAGGEQRGHVNAARALRISKARKIEALLSGLVDLPTADVLDLGTGSGILAEYFRDRAKSVTAADRDIGEFRVEGITPVEITGPVLPFEDASFDFVVFNHVIEHVGERPAQAAMLDEIRRVLRPSGWLYLAVPNRWALVEPHYGLPLLGALPQRTADWLVRKAGKNPVYECRPFPHGELMTLMQGRFRQVHDMTAAAFREVMRIEKAGTVAARLAAAIPDAAVRAAVPAMPTLIVLASQGVEARP